MDLKIWLTQNNIFTVCNLGLACSYYSVHLQYAFIIHNVIGMDMESKSLQVGKRNTSTNTNTNISTRSVRVVIVVE